VISFALAGLWVSYGIDGYQIVSMPLTDAQPNPLAKTVAVGESAWMTNYSLYPWMIVAPVLSFVGAIATVLLARAHRPGFGFISSGLSITGVILTAGFSLFPFIMPSSLMLDASLTVWDAPSSQRTLTVMFWAAVIFVPIILMYTVWTYRALWGRVTVKSIQDNTHSVY
jgi:cytochrome d ubiquinol oxidase subunit II